MGKIVFVAIRTCIAMFSELALLTEVNNLVMASLVSAMIFAEYRAKL